MRERQKELKKKLKQQKKAEKTLQKKKDDDQEKRISDNSNDSDLPEKYIEENITERQYVDQDGKVQKEIIKTEVLKTRSRSRSKPRSKITADGITHTEHIDLTTGHQDSVIKTGYIMTPPLKKSFKTTYIVHMPNYKF
ncbi:unnamed protein product [Oikopleura dioica]|uniref:Uncharacterized protein n=1 Tax=Oikopleura dioica TaxID=34765 RepID=E4Y7C9_OIKDI|nr:unnamed protein product [Oikopleura dioica]